MSRLLFLDIECTGLKADFGHLLAFGYKWQGTKKVECPTILDFPGKFTTDDKNLVKVAHKVLGSADAWCTYNGKRFDIPWLNAKFAEHGLPFLPNVPHIDLYYTAKSNLAISRKSLQNVSILLNLENRKTAVSGKIWKLASAGHTKSIGWIKRHCIDDILVLEEAYERLRPLIRTHPRLSGFLNCRFCGSSNLQRRGWHVGPLLPKRRIWCKDCGGWDTRSVPKSEVPVELIRG